MKTTGYILNGKYYKGENPDIEKMKHEANSTYKEWDHDRQRRGHRHDLIQPYKDGQVNPEFVEHYPEESKERGFING